MFRAKEKRAILEKYYQLRSVKQGMCSAEELANQITERRVEWISKNLRRKKIYSGKPLLELAYDVIFLDHMKINPDHSHTQLISENKLIITSENFCPYLEACRMLGLDTRYVCREIGEPSIQEMLRIIDPKLRFSRNYQNIRPYNRNFCEEYIELTDL
jgi:hypothetical protein